MSILKSNQRHWAAFVALLLPDIIDILLGQPMVATQVLYDKMFVGVVVNDVVCSSLNQNLRFHFIIWKIVCLSTTHNMNDGKDPLSTITCSLKWISGGGEERWGVECFCSAYQWWLGSCFSVHLQFVLLISKRKESNVCNPNACRTISRHRYIVSKNWVLLKSVNLKQQNWQK